MYSIILKDIYFFNSKIKKAGSYEKWLKNVRTTIEAADDVLGIEKFR